MKDGLAVLLDGGGHEVEVLGVLGMDGTLGEAQRVDKGDELATEVLLDEGVVVNVGEGLEEDVGLLGGEVHDLGEVVGAFVKEGVAAAVVNDGEAALLEVVEVTVNGGFGHAKLLGEVGGSEVVAMGQDVGVGFLKWRVEEDEEDEEKESLGLRVEGRLFLYSARNRFL